MSEDAHISGGSMYCLSDDVWGNPCGKYTESRCEKCEVLWCAEHMENHVCFPATKPRTGSTISELEEMVERHAGIDMLGE